MKLTLVATVAAAVLTLLAPMTVSSPSKAIAAGQACQQGRPLVDVTYGFLNEQDLNSDGYVWALDDGQSRFRLFQTGLETFCAVSSSSGTFTTFAGPSPAGTGTIPAGLEGTFRGQIENHFV